MAELLAALGLTAPLSPFSASAPFGLPLLVARVALLAVAYAGGRRRAFVVAGALFALSLAAYGAFVPFVIAAVFTACGKRRGLTSAILVMLSCVALAFLPSRAAAPPPSDDAAAETVYWVGHDNLLRAHFAAARWAGVERGRGEGHLALASLDWELDHRAEALDLAADVAANGDGDDVRRRASALLRAWSCR